MFNNVSAGNVHSEFSTLIKFESLIAHWYVKKQFDWGKDNVVTQKKKGLKTFTCKWGQTFIASWNLVDNSNLKFWPSVDTRLHSSCYNYQELSMFHWGDLNIDEFYNLLYQTVRHIL